MDNGHICYYDQHEILEVQVPAICADANSRESLGLRSRGRHAEADM